ncbi:MAG: hypothetical protein ACXVZR_08465 [Terriglobales bacterium]
MLGRVLKVGTGAGVEVVTGEALLRKRRGGYSNQKQEQAAAYK